MEVVLTAKQTTNPYEDLANAIILTAVADYRKVLRSLKRKPRNKAQQAEKESLEQFFRGSWYKTLTSVDGEYLIKKLQEENIS